MRFPHPLRRGTLVQRYKRFLADVRLDDGEIVTAHCANSGSMLGCALPDSEVWLSPAANPERKLRHTWEMVRVGSTLVGINTSLSNHLVAEAIAAGTIVELAGYSHCRREVRYGTNSRIDLLLEDPQRPICWVEVKNVTLRQGDHAAFPDAVTARGAKHLNELAARARAGERAVMVYLVQREDCRAFTVADGIDPAYAAALGKARKAGVETLVYTCRLTPAAITVDRPLLIDL